MDLSTIWQDITLQGGTAELVFILGGIVVLALLIMAVSYFVYVVTPQGRMNALLKTRAAKTKRRAAPLWMVRLLVLVMFVGGLAYAADYSGAPEQCAQCHGESAQAAALATSAHLGVECMSCHRRTGVAGPLRTAVMYVRWVYTYAAEREEPQVTSGSVEDAACLACHDYVRSETTELKGIRVRHSDFLEEGARCRDCHNSTAHPGAVQQSSEPEMSACIVCHDGEYVSAECDVCHVSDPLEYTVSGAPIPKIDDLDTGNCYGCHDNEESCLWCHGQTMPHPEGWGPTDGQSGPGGHARFGFTERETCYRCHYGQNGIFERSTDNCQPCHDTPGRMHGGEAWVAEHGLQATGQKTGTFSECYLCHHSQWFCASCHPASYQKLYDPRSGPDRYERDLPLPPESYFDF